MRILTENLHSAVSDLVARATHSVFVYAPYILKVPLEKILRNKKPSTSFTIITTWKVPDILRGTSDLSIFHLCKENDVPLYLNQRLHLKTYLVDYKQALVGSANITGRALGLVPDPNYETLVELESVPNEYLLYLQKIRYDSILVTEKIFARFEETCKQFEDKYSQLGPIDQDQILFDSDLGEGSAFSISSLPMSRSIKVLYETLKGGQPSNAGDIARAMNDIVNFDLEGCLKSEDFSEFRDLLRNKFFSHPFIEKLVGFIDRPRRFGEIKEWIQKNCSDIPKPGRGDLNDVVQVLYIWLIELGADRFEYSRPNITEILSPKFNRRS